jgi:hypothetical protein
MLQGWAECLAVSCAVLVFLSLFSRFGVLSVIAR